MPRLVLRGCWQWPSITLSGKDLLSFATGANHRGHRLRGRLHFAAGHAGRWKVNRESLGMEEEWAPWERDTVLTLCLGTLNNVISDSVGLRTNQSFCYWTGSSDYSSWTFDIHQRQVDPAWISLLHHRLRIRRCVFFTTFSYWSKSSVFCEPQVRWKYS